PDEIPRSPCREALGTRTDLRPYRPVRGQAAAHRAASGSLAPVPRGQGRDLFRGTRRNRAAGGGGRAAAVDAVARGRVVPWGAAAPRAHGRRRARLRPVRGVAAGARRRRPPGGPLWPWLTVVALPPHLPCLLC